jgi:hypothetical protein
MPSFPRPYAPREPVEIQCIFFFMKCCLIAVLSRMVNETNVKHKFAQARNESREKQRRGKMTPRLAKLLQRVVLLPTPCSAAAKFSPSPTAPSPPPPPIKGNKDRLLRFLIAGDSCCRRDLRHQVLWDVFHVRLYSCWVQWLVVFQVFKVVRVVFKVSLQLPPFPPPLVGMHSKCDRSRRGCAV